MTHLFLGTNTVCLGVIEGYCPYMSNASLQGGGELGTTAQDAETLCDAPRDGVGSANPATGDEGLLAAKLGAAAGERDRRKST